MINIEDLSYYFNEIIESDSEMFNLELKEVFKINGEVKYKIVSEQIKLKQINKLEEIFETDNFEIMDYYPKTFFKKIFNIKNSELKFEGDETNFILVSDKTKENIKTNCRLFHIDEDDKIIFGKRGRLIIYQKDGKLFTNVDSKNYKTYIIK